jgi:small subunit ribosomal protein S1
MTDPNNQSDTRPADQTATEQGRPDAPAPSNPRPEARQRPEPPALDADTLAEIEAAMDDLAEADAAHRAPIRGPREVKGGREHRTGTVVSVGTDVFVEFGPKELGVVEMTQWKEDQEKPKVGEQLEVVVQRYNPTESLFICALPGAVQKADWEMLEVGQIVEARVSGVNKGGLELEVANHRAFMPASQVDVNRIPDLSIFVGEKLTCQIQKLDKRGGGNIVLSRRDILQAERAKAAEGLRETLNEGDTVEGVVRKIMDFGAFVDLGGVDGLIHLNDLSHDRVNHGAKSVAKFVSEGQKVTVQVLKIDWDANRISLGLKQLQGDPFASAKDEIVEGATLTGKVTNTTEFGAFVEIAPGVEGLVHISELDYKRVNKVEDAVQKGEVVQVRVLKVDPDSRKISLSIKQTKEAPAGAGGPGGGGGPGRGRGGKGRGDRDDRDPAEILKETPQLRRMREQAKQREKQAQKHGKGSGGLGDVGGLGIGLGDLKL